MCLYVLGSAPALSGAYCTRSAAVLTLPPSRVCNSSGSTRKRIIVSTRTRLRQCRACVPSSRSPGAGEVLGEGRQSGFFSRSRKRKTGRGGGECHPEEAQEQEENERRRAEKGCREAREE